MGKEIMKSTGWIRHGDVILERIDVLPNDVVLKKVDRAVLAEGEVTGHFHVLQSECLFAEQEGVKFVDLSQDALLVHEEHNTLLIPKGVYKVVLQREVDLLGQVRQVMD